jgi:hypothetical protein
VKREREREREKKKKKKNSTLVGTTYQEEIEKMH